MISKIIINNVLATIIHGLICLIVYFRYVHLGYQFEMSSYSFVEMSSLLNVIMSLIIYVFLYFLCGRYILRNTHDKYDNISSVMLLTAVMILALFFDQVGYFDPFLAMIYIPFEPLGRILPFVGWLMVILLPSFALWMGLMSNMKQKEAKNLAEEIAEAEEQDTLK